MNAKHPTIARIAEVFRLDDESGAIFWKTSSRGHRADSRAGSEQADGYWRVYFDGSRLPVHRIVWAMVNGRWPMPGRVIDHINGIPGDNRPCNLREATWKANAQNRQRASADNKSGSGVPGVCRVNGRYCVHLRIDGRIRFLGAHDHLESAEQSALLLRRQHYAGNTL